MNSSLTGTDVRPPVDVSDYAAEVGERVRQTERGGVEGAKGLIKITPVLDSRGVIFHAHHLFQTLLSTRYMVVLC